MRSSPLFVTHYYIFICFLYLIVKLICLFDFSFQPAILYNRSCDEGDEDHGKQAHP